MDLKGLIHLVSSSRISVTADSRQVVPGSVFVAVPGTTNDGHDFIPKAIEAGAIYIVAQKNVPVNGAELVIVPDSHAAWGLLAQAASGNPGAQLTSLAVTGTNGKTTITFLVRSIIQAAGSRCGMIGTVTYDTGAGAVESNMTTPDASSLAHMMAEMVGAGSKYMVIEASSHALSQKRLAGIDFKAAAFTNLTGDHLDYHKDMDNYLAAKSLLFEALAPEAFAVLNKQDPAAAKLAAKTKAKVLYYAVDEPAEISAHVIEMNADCTIYDLVYGGKKVRIKSPLLGRHNISNHLAAAGLCIGAGISLETIAKGLESLTVVPGRLQAVRCGQPFAVLVDYAHTDDALQNVLTTLKPICRNKLTVVFGCGGDRDKTKRPRMAKVAAKLADKIVVTCDNPRTEDPNQIIKDILAGLPTAATNVTVEPDRKKAIGAALASAAKDDIVLIAGKGHETYQIIGKQKFDFCDKTVAESFLKNL
jgi:UDP-N-acetylmuramoyl-L-alanyl-D-glutamate--2,6-diaminopimelate ligase